MKSRSNTSLIVLGSALALSFMLPAPSWPETRVIDGDTIVHNTERVRLFGLDCPELREKDGQLAKEQLRLLVEGNRIFLERVDRDRYGRTVARVRVQRQTRGEFFTFDASCAMISKGTCKEYVRYSRGEYKRCAP